MENILKKIGKVCVVFLLVFIILGSFGNVAVAAINEGYGDNLQSFDLDEDEVIESSPITNYIGSFIYTIGVLIEKLTSNIMAILTGDKSFPWADKVIFNTIPMLDVNFINPDDKSLLNFSNGIGEIIRNIYFTGLSVALGFLGIIIAVMAIKLVISTIASEKARYKEAIIKWLTAIILLFGMHFVLSFLFYMNEQLVIMASNILKESIKSSSEQLSSVIDSTLNGNKQRVVLNFCNNAIESAAWAEAYSWTTPIGWVSNAVQWVADVISPDDENAQKVAVAQSNAQYLMDNYEVTYMLINNSSIREYGLNFIMGNSENNWLENVSTSIAGSIGGIFGYSAASTEIGWLKDNVEFIINGLDENQYNKGMAQVREMEKNGEDSVDYKAAQLLRVIYTYAYQYRNGTFESENSSLQIIGELGEYFKTTAWYTDIENGGWSPSSASIVGATLYTIFVFQSLMFFIAYIKRFFYVVVLSVIAPLVVIYDFFTKSATL